MSAVMPADISQDESPAGVSSTEPLIASASGTAVVALLKRVQSRIAPVWPLRDYVAVNPLKGFSQHSFLTARSALQRFSDCELLMPLEYFQGRFRQGRIGPEDIQRALCELSEDGWELPPAAAGQSALEQLVEALSATSSSIPAESSDSSVAGGDEQQPGSQGRVHTVLELIDRFGQTSWSELVMEEVSRNCGAHYDAGQSVWTNPWKELPLYQAWRESSRYDRTMEYREIDHFRRFVSQLPFTPEACVAILLDRLRIPVAHWETYLLASAFTMPGWSSWTTYQQESSSHRGVDCNDFAGLLAMRLAHETALFESSRIPETVLRKVDREIESWGAFPADRQPLSDDSIWMRYVLMRANEIASRNNLLSGLAASLPDGTNPSEPSEYDVDETHKPTRPLAQLVFCIDVRSERFRRNLEATSDQVETLGFAGFFGVPMEYARLHEHAALPHVPALLTPEFRVQEGFPGTSPEQDSMIQQRRTLFRTLRKSWKQLQASAVSCFAFVESTGWLSGLRLLVRQFGRPDRFTNARFDGVPREYRQGLGPQLSSQCTKGLTLDRQVELAEGILRGTGLTEGLARLVVLCGHGAQTDNNPLQAGLECGACGGHSGEPNARFAAALLNHPVVRYQLKQRGLEIPEDTRFLAGLHDTTSDQLTFFDTDSLPTTHHRDLELLLPVARTAEQLTRDERQPLLSASNTGDILRRCRDWSEVRPEWGLAGNWAFIAGPRSLTKSVDLDGQVFLHSYDFQRDNGFGVLEQIMTAPLIVAHWINMQYFASTVDNRYFGSGDKTIHNVVGQFGVFSGNGGDLQTGLPWQSLHDGQDYQHHPRRLLGVIAAPPAAIERIIMKHSHLADLLHHDWLHLIAINGDEVLRYSASGHWHQLEISAAEALKSAHQDAVSSRELATATE